MSFVELPFTFPTRTMKLYSWVRLVSEEKKMILLCHEKWLVILYVINFLISPPFPFLYLSYSRKELKEAFRLYDKEGERNQ